jgi:hypothetical protein
MRRISPPVNVEMQHVGKQWQSDLDRFLNRGTQLRLHAADDTTRLFTPAVAIRTKKTQGSVIKAEGPKAKKRLRPQKCWHCTERHFNHDSVCPMRGMSQSDG